MRAIVPLARLTALFSLVLPLVACDDSIVDPEPDAAGVEQRCASVGEIPVGQTRSGALSPTDCESDGHLVDRWSLRLASQMPVRIDLRSGAFDAYLELRTESGGLIAGNDDWGSLDSRIEQTLAAGAYVVVARSLHPGGTGSYQLSVLDNTACAAFDTVTLGAQVTGELESSDCAGDWNAPEDRWRLELPQARRLRLDLESADFDEVLLIRNPQGHVINGSDWNHPAGHARVEMEVGPGTWTISATAASPTQRGSYELIVDDPPPCTPGIDLVLGQTVEGEITANDCFFQGGWAPADSFAIDVAVETPVRIHMKGVGFQTHMVLRNAQGQDVATSFGPFPSADARIRAWLSPGRYALFAWGDHPFGSYSLSIEEDVCAEPQAIEFGGSADGALDAEDCMRPGGAFQDLWELVLDSDALTRIDLSATAFDPYLILMDASGDVLDTDDDGPGYDARIERALTAGTYLVAASSYHPGATGPYTLAVGAPPASTGGPDADGPSGAKPAPRAQPVVAPLSAPEPTWRALLGGIAERSPKAGW